MSIKIKSLFGTKNNAFIKCFKIKMSRRGTLEQVDDVCVIGVRL